MNTLRLSRFNAPSMEPYLKHKTSYTGFLVIAGLLLFWPIAQRIVTNGNESIGVIDPNIWMLILLSLICFLVVTGLCWWILQKFWLSLGLPGIGSMVSQFKTLESWQQLTFFWASFALLLLTMLGILMAVI